MAEANAPAPSPTNSFEGLHFSEACTGGQCGQGHPPDPNGDVGPTYYIQTINVAIGIYNKSTGSRVAGFTFDDFMSHGNFGNICDTDNFGDPVVVYDTFTDRWVITGLAFQIDSLHNILNPPGVYQCFAVSRSGDPVSGGWNFYSMSISGGLDDYPKFGIWPDGLYMSANMYGYSATSSFQNVRVWALNKAQMYAGNPTAQAVMLDAATRTGPCSIFSLVPANARVQAGVPPAGAPNPFASIWCYTGLVRVWKFHVDWANTANTTFTGPTDSSTGSNWGAPPSTVPELNGNGLDTIPMRAMMQNQYSKPGLVESIWVSHTVAGSSSSQAAVRWYQVPVTGGTIGAALQASTYNPDSTVNRFVPSLAVDRAGNMTMGYSVSNSAMYPAIRYAGRLTTDATNTLGQTETTLIQGTGAQTIDCGGSACTRWGDYSAMTLDPNGCTFWFTSEYYVTSGGDHHTRIGSFAYPSTNCQPVVAGTLQGTVRDAATNDPIAGATVTAGPTSRLTDATGNYSFAPIAAGSYTVTVNANGYASASASVGVSANATTTQDFALTATTSMHTLSVSKTGTGTGTVTSSPAGINCGTTCSASFPSGTSVGLMATPYSNSVFSSWGGDCSGTSTTCSVTMSADRSVTASFNDKPVVAITAPTGGSFLRQTVAVSASASDGNGVSMVEFFLDGTANANEIGQDASAPYAISWDTTGVADGSHSLVAKATDALGTTNTSAAVAVTVDNTAPTFTITSPTSLTAAVTLTFSEIVHGLTSSNVTFRERDSGSSIANTMSCFNASAVAVTCNTGDVLTAKLKPSAALIPGQYYRVMVNPTGAASLVVDRAGNPVAMNAFRDFRASTFQQQNSPRAVYRWRNVSNTNAYGGSYYTEHLSGASASFGFSGTSVTWYTVTGPSQGLAYVYIDGVNMGSFNQYASSTHYKVARSFTGLSGGTHTIKIVVRGLVGSSAGTGTYISVDAFLVGSTLYSSPSVTYTWHQTSASGASGGSYVTTNIRGCYVTFTFRGTGIDWYTVKGPNQGKAYVYMDGVLLATVDNYASTTAYKIGWSIRGLTDAVHTIKITVLGQHRSASTGNSIGIDAWGIV